MRSFTLVRDRSRMPDAESSDDRRGGRLERGLVRLEMRDDTITNPGDTEDLDDDQTLAPANSDDVVLEHTQPSAAGQPRRGERIRELLYKLPGTREQVPATAASQADLSEITATTVLLDRSGSERITADRVSLDHSGARTIDAKSVQFDRSGVVALGTDHAVLLHSSAIQVVSEEARITDSSVIFLSADKASLDNSRIVFFSGSADGDIRAVMTTRTAAIVTAIMAIALVILKILGRAESKRGASGSSSVIRRRMGR